jgi:hypothetical protein
MSKEKPSGLGVEVDLALKHEADAEERMKLCPVMDSVDSSRICTLGFRLVEKGYATDSDKEEPNDSGWIYVQFHSGVVWRYGLFKRMNFENLKAGGDFVPPSIGKAFGEIKKACETPGLGLKAEKVWPVAEKAKS